MITAQYKLTSPQHFETFYEDIDYNKKDFILIRPTYLSLCKADLRYFLGQRDPKVLKEKLPLALIHEGVGVVLNDPSGTYEKNTKVVLLPNLAGNQTQYDENYRRDSIFMSSKADGFMQEIVSLPLTNVVKYQEVSDEIASFSEFITIGIHAIESFLKKSHQHRKNLLVWGDGGLGYIVSCLLKSYFPDSKVTVIGKTMSKLELFHFADVTQRIGDMDHSTLYDHAFECVGGQVCGTVINEIIDCIHPEGTITLLGVSEEPVPINTRMVLEKGLTLVGRSRSTRENFEKCIALLEGDKKLQTRLSFLISQVCEINKIQDLYHVFETSQHMDFKTILQWNI